MGASGSKFKEQVAKKTKEDAHKMRHAKRVCFSHEFIGKII